ncbi:MAG TPA: VOC family protein [Candidatus Acidoferrales bacterium]|nr:VOC family protein [Candidatus Acidoferrales bacterium]
MIARRVWLLLAGLLLTPMFLATSAFPQSAGKDDLGIVRLRYATVVVADYDQALHWYTDVLGLVKTEDGTFGEQDGKIVTAGKNGAAKRWLVVAPRGQKDFGIILEIAKPIASDDPIHNYEARVGTETRWVFEVEDCHKFYDQASKRGVKFVEKPVDEVWGVTEAMFEDLYGNIFVIQSTRPKPTSSNR